MFTSVSRRIFSLAASDVFSGTRFSVSAIIGLDPPPQIWQPSAGSESP
jgi:hypothetical protein